jgi:fatty-acyl-CoA synthase
LADAAARLAGGMRRRGVGRGDKVGILVENRREWLEAAFAAWALGAVAVPLSTWSKAAELDFLIGDAGLSLLIAEDRFAETLAGLGELPRVVLLGRDYGALSAEPVERDAAMPGDDCLVLYTSGSRRCGSATAT